MQFRISHLLILVFFVSIAIVIFVGQSHPYKVRQLSHKMEKFKGGTEISEATKLLGIDLSKSDYRSWTHSISSCHCFKELGDGYRLRYTEERRYANSQRGVMNDCIHCAVFDLRIQKRDEQDFGKWVDIAIGN